MLAVFIFAFVNTSVHELLSPHACVWAFFMHDTSKTKTQLDHRSAALLMLNKPLQSRKKQSRNLSLVVKHGLPLQGVFTQGEFGIDY